MAKEKAIEMHFPVSFVRDYVQKWAESAKKEAKNEQERAIIADIVTMVGVASQVMVQTEKPTK